ncbi:unnamed protein product [Periconia digitata]|uniref:Uncharacterized protein n=1 Tax=Periconia digitata TaxID=1303443 RepID=A0A9W4UIG8_9PLEO|nr:unnamed protein product [Periconia digitata]
MANTYNTTVFALRRLRLTPHVNWKWDVDYTAPLAGLPQVIVPIGQYEYVSRITNALEKLPISVAVISARGSEIAILKFLEEFLKSEHLPLSVETGRFAF